MEAKLAQWHKSQWMREITRPSSEIRVYVCDRFAAQILEMEPKLGAWKEKMILEGAQFFAPKYMQNSDNSNERWCWYVEDPEGETPFVWDVFLGWRNMRCWFDTLSDDAKETFQQWISGCWNRDEFVFLTGNKEFCDKVMIKEIPREEIFCFIDGLAMDCRYVDKDQDEAEILQLEW